MDSDNGSLGEYLLNFKRNYAMEAVLNAKKHARKLRAVFHEDQFHCSIRRQFQATSVDKKMVKLHVSCPV